jgi:elongation factor G
MLNDHFGRDRHVVKVTHPLGIGKPDFNQVCDVVTQKMNKFATDKSGNFETTDVPADLKDTIAKAHEVLVEDAAEGDDAFMEHFFESGQLTDEEFTAGFRKGILDRKIIPVFAASAANSIGVKTLLDFIVTYCPSPVERPAKSATDNGGKEINIETKTDIPFSAFVFKTISEMHVGELSLFRVYSGSVKTGDDVMNSTKSVMERISSIFLLNGKDRVDAGVLSAGDIGALVKLRDTHTNNTLCDKGHIVRFKETAIPEPIITFGIVPRGKTDETKISTGLHSLHAEDPSFVFSYDAETSQSIVSGQGEMHLMIVTKRLKDRFGVDVDLIDAKIPYKETIRSVCKDAEFKHKKQSGGRGQYGHVHIKVEPKHRSSGFEFVDDIVGGVVPGRFIPAVEKGVNDAMISGVIAGYPVVDVKVTLFDGTYHDVDSDELSFKIAGAQAFRKGFREAKPIMLEPIYELEVRIPEEYLGAIMGDISGRRGQILGMVADGHFQIVKAQIALAEIQKYATILRSMTSGRGSFRKKFLHFAELPAELAQKIIQDYEEKKAAGEK